jgi:hypothetical protein
VGAASNADDNRLESVRCGWIQLPRASAAP